MLKLISVQGSDTTELDKYLNNGWKIKTISSSSAEYEKIKEKEVINSMIPIWKKDKKKVKDEEYESFYSEKFNDYETY